MSAKRAEQHKQYLGQRRDYLSDHVMCERCGRYASQDIHHMAGRVGELLTNMTYFMAVCRGCHDAIHQNMKESEQQGYVIRLR